MFPEFSFRIKLVISYVGTRFCGWQKQRGSAAEGDPSIQESMEIALTKIFGQEVKVHGSGRTDSGVHAIGQVAHFDLPPGRDLEMRRLRLAVNHHLPSTIQVLDCSKVSAQFHAQRSAVSKQYSFYFQQGGAAVPMIAPFSWWIRKPLDIEKMNRAAQTLLGEHEFVVFQASGGEAKNTVRTILEIEVTRSEVPFPMSGIEGVKMVRLRVRGTGFLKQMVRAIAGTLVDVGEGRLDSSIFEQVLASQDRSDLGVTAPPHGLWLESVEYT